MNYEKTVLRVSQISILLNALLTAFKLAAGIAANSGAMVSDAVHSASDVFSTLIVIAGVKLAGREADAHHPYGHERFECIAALALTAVLAATGLLIGYNSVRQLAAIGEATPVAPGLPALIAAVISIMSKEAMYQYTKHYADRLDSGALRADAWHHRSDALSSVASFIGIGGARLGFLRLEPLASLVICFFIVKAAVSIASDSLEKMVDHCCDEKMQQEMRAVVGSVSGVNNIDGLTTRKFGNKIYVDVEISADGQLSLAEGHRIAENVHSALEEHFPSVKHAMVHVNPSEETLAPTPMNKT
ncbi:MAG: cation diffusion facilitator family transporter [Eubacteriales bacterium]|nr:cation diffusion facilitator family transporter [Eubacteriales bacterium]